MVGSSRGAPKSKYGEMKADSVGVEKLGDIFTRRRWAWLSLLHETRGVPGLRQARWRAKRGM